MGPFFAGAIIWLIDDVRCWICCWLVVAGTKEFFVTFQKQLGIVTPTDEVHQFSEGWLNHQPVRVLGGLDGFGFRDV